MEPDFSTRHDLESIIPNSDPDSYELLNRYKFPPAEHQVPRPPQQQFQGSFPIAVQGNSEAVMLGHMIGQLQGTLQSTTKKSNFDGLSLSVDSDILRWVVLFLFLALLVWVIYTVNKKDTSADPRLEKLERQIRKLRKRGRRKRKKRKNPEIIQESSDFDDEDFDVKEFDLLEE